LRVGQWLRVPGPASSCSLIVGWLYQCPAPVRRGEIRSQDHSILPHVETPPNTLSATSSWKVGRVKPPTGPRSAPSPSSPSAQLVPRSKALENGVSILPTGAARWRLLCRSCLSCCSGNSGSSERVLGRVELVTEVLASWESQRAGGVAVAGAATIGAGRWRRPEMMLCVFSLSLYAAFAQWAASVMACLVARVR